MGLFTVREIVPSRLFVYAAAVALPVAATLLGAQVALPAFVFEHVMVILVVGLATAGGRSPAVVAAVVGAIGDNLLLREPIGRPAITGGRDAVDLGLFLLVAVAVGWLVDGLRTAKVRAQQAADRERFAREELDRLIATVTHDLATPLSAIHGTIQFARKHAALSDVDLDRLLARIETASARATSLVKTLADTKSIQQASMSLELRPVDLRTLVEPIAKMLDRISDRHPIVLAMAAEPLVINGDAEHIRRVVENLITNAIKYSPDGGAIEIQLCEADGEVVLTIRDHGMGIPIEVRGRIFELGYRAPQAAGVAPGLGLGLYTATEIIRRHGGTIAVTAAEGNGTMFLVRLPLARYPTTLNSVTRPSSQAIH